MKVKELLISIKPEHLVNILNGKKTLELRKTVPKGFKGWVYIYVTKGKPYIRELGDNYFTECSKVDVYKLNGKVVARFWFDEYTYIFDYRKIENWDFPKPYYVYNSLLTFRVMALENKICLTEKQINDYGKGKDLYAWHIKKLGVFDTPLSFSDFGIKRPPQSWQYVYVKEQDDE